MAGRKIFVGSLPDGIHQDDLREEFGKHGEIEEVYVKANCDPGRQMAFITFATQQGAKDAKEATDRVLKFPGSEKTCEVMLARNQGKYGHNDDAEDGGSRGSRPVVVAAVKIFVGSLPDDISETSLREEFSKYGKIVDIYLKTGCETGKQWGFISFASAEEAQLAKSSTDNKLEFPGADKPCEVMLARNQGGPGQGQSSAPAPVHSNAQGPTKVFVGSLPDSITEDILRHEFSRYGRIAEVHLKTGCEPGKNWCFLTFMTHGEAKQAKDSTDRVLVLPGGDRAVEAMFAKNQGKNGQDPVPRQSEGAPSMGYPQMGYGGHTQMQVHQPPPPSTPRPPHLTAWTVYYTPQGLPYYFNSATRVTQWECPPEFQYAQALAAQQAQAGQAQQMQAMQAQQMQAQQQYAAYYGAMRAAGQPPMGPYGY